MKGKLIVETIFCDAEYDQTVQRTYFRRLRRTMLALSNVVIPNDLEVVHLLYVSVDKGRWIAEIEALAAALRDVGVDGRVVMYGHPQDGYGNGGHAHPDTLKGPNKQHPRRNLLFRSTGEHRVGGTYDFVARATLDDDDLWLPWQAMEIHRVCSELVHESVEQVVGVGFRNTLIAHSTEDSVRVQSVAMNRMLTGNKFYFYPTAEFDRIESLSPWNVPELMTVNYRERYRRTGVDLRIQEHNRPGFVYMRRGENLSAQNKTNFIIRTAREEIFPDEPAMYRGLSTGEGVTVSEQGQGVEYGIDPAQYRISVRRTPEGDVAYSTDAQDVHGPRSVLAFHLLDGTQVVQRTEYGQAASGVFRGAPRRCRVKVFVKSEDGRRESKVSNFV